MHKIIIFVCFLWPLLSKAEDPKVLLEHAVALVGSGAQRSWKNHEIGQKLRQIRTDYSQTPQALDATAFLAFYLSQIPGDNSKETYELCDEVSKKAPNSWQAWMANCAKISTWGLREGENQKTLDVALEALAQTHGEKLCRDPNSMLILKPLMEQWPPVATDFTDVINLVITQQAFVLSKSKLGKEHLSKIANPKMIAFSERCMTRYLREHPEEAIEQIEEKKHAASSVIDSKSSAIPRSDIGTQLPTEPLSVNPSRQFGGQHFSWIIVLIVIGGIITIFYQRRS